MNKAEKVFIKVAGRELKYIRMGLEKGKDLDKAIDFAVKAKGLEATSENVKAFKNIAENTNKLESGIKEVRSGKLKNTKLEDTKEKAQVAYEGTQRNSSKIRRNTPESFKNSPEVKERSYSKKGDNITRTITDSAGNKNTEKIIVSTVAGEKSGDLERKFYFKNNEGNVAEKTVNTYKGNSKPTSTGPVKVDEPGYSGGSGSEENSSNLLKDVKNWAKRKPIQAAAVGAGAGVAGYMGYKALGGNNG